MKLKDSEKGLLLVIFGIAVLALSFLYLIKPNYDNTQALNSESQQLQMKLNELRAKQAKRDEYLAGTEEFNKAFDKILANFPADLKQEVTIMFLQGIKDDNEFDIASLGLGAKEAFYTLGLNMPTETLPTTEDTATETSTTEATTTQATTEAPLTEDGESVDPNAYTCYRAAFPISYTGSYESLKNVLSYINNFSSRMTVDAVDIAYDAEGDIYSGTMNLMCYSIESSERPQSNLELNDVETGINNIFTGDGTAASTTTSGMNKYDENDGVAIENKYDFYAMLNPSSSDVSAKVVGQNGSGKDASIISNSDNSVSTLSYDIYEVDGKKYCKYTLDNSTSYEAEITSAEDLTILFQSSARKNKEDEAGVRITIRNSTSLPVYVKVAGDDPVNPRVDIVSKTGAVKVYK